MANIDSLLKDLEKRYGQGSVMKLTSDPLAVERVSSGSINFDAALGGGIPVGRIAEFFGPEAGGKTTIAILTMIEYQLKFPEKFIAFIDVEHTFNQVLAQEYGLDLEKLIFSQPNSGEEAIDISEALIRSGNVSLVVLDSVSSLVPLAEAEEDMEKQSMGLQARLMSKGLRKLNPAISKFNTTMIFINQLREKIGGYGDPTTTSGGRSLKFYASIRVSVRAGDKIEDAAKNRIGHTINVNVVKNKVAPPNKVAAFDLIYTKGVDRVKEIADYAILAGIVDRGGAWIRIKDGENLISRTVDGESIIMNFQGKDKFVDHLRKDTELYDIFVNSFYNQTILTVEDLKN